MEKLTILQKHQTKINIDVGKGASDAVNTVKNTTQT